MKFDPDWKQAWTWFSMQLATIGAALPVVWMQLPDELKAGLPEWSVPVIAVAWLVLFIFGRLVKQGDQE